MSDTPQYSPLETCMVLNTRRAARAITKRYNALLAPYELQSTQGSLLFAISRGNFGSISDLSEMMAIERSALTRNIHLLRRRGLVVSEGAKQGKAQKVALTEEGQALVELIKPKWLEAQKGVWEALGKEDWDSVQSALAKVGKL